jgi:hypothetical protein
MMYKYFKETNKLLSEILLDYKKNKNNETYNEIDIEYFKKCKSSCTLLIK